MRSFSVQVLLAVALACLSGPFHSARAQTTSQNANYEDTIRHAVEEYSLGHWTEARFFFARAHALSPNARTLRGLGLTCYESRNYVEAIGYFKQALASTEQPLTDKMRADLTQLLQQSEQFVTRVVVTLDPSSAELEVDHVPRELTDGALLLDPGEHLLSATAEGHQPTQQTINAAGGEQRVELSLPSKVESAPALVQQPTAAPLPALEPSSGSSDLAPYIVMGAGGAALIAGAVLVGIAASDKSAVENADDGATWPELEPRYNRGRTFFPVGFALMGVGLAGVAAGLTWKLWPSSQERAPSARLHVSPLGVQLSGGF
ncbi:MAG TPA: tetratricopeptide repeat protein [Polyangiales bacterium]|nr:tetratricopeptide repeat protein [Polyangiales bacterium]